MKYLLMLATFLLPAPLMAGVVVDKGDAFWWVTDHQLNAPNNDDYMGTFDDSPNKVNVNSFHEPEGPRSRQRVDAIELLVPTNSSGGITEYALNLGGNQPESTPGSDFLLKLDNLYIVELGFGTGENFVPAGRVVSGLRFDTPGMVSPELEAARVPPPAELPLFSLVDHQSDYLILQGRYDVGNFLVGSFASPEVLKMPLDIPDLPISARDFYSAVELAGLEASEVPFTIRMHVVPEPASIVLLLAGIAGAILLRRYR